MKHAVANLRDSSYLAVEVLHLYLSNTSGVAQEVKIDVVAPRCTAQGMEKLTHQYGFAA